MEIKLHKNFEKQFLKLRKNQKEKFRERRSLFLQNEFSPILNNHALNGKYLEYRSINVAGDLRIVFKKEGINVIFMSIDSHSNLYG